MYHYQYGWSDRKFMYNIGVVVAFLYFTHLHYIQYEYDWQR